MAHTSDELIGFVAAVAVAVLVGPLLPAAGWLLLFVALCLFVAVTR